MHESFDIALQALPHSSECQDWPVMYRKYYHAQVRKPCDSVQFRCQSRLLPHGHRVANGLVHNGLR